MLTKTNSKEERHQKDVKCYSEVNLSPKILQNYCQIASLETETLKLVKKINTDLEDLDLINSCFTKHFFMRVLDQRSR